MPKKAVATTGTPVEALTYADKRANIPTEELRDFVAEYEAAPKSVLYPRDPSLDPQLVWKGKDEQDRKSLDVPVVPVYIQEKIQPRALVEDLRAAASAAEPDQLSLFADFDKLEFGDLVEFYQHEQSWANRLILGDSLLVMTSLAEKEGLKGKVQMIYLDPPYGIKFGSNWQVSTRKRSVTDGKAEDLTRQPEQIKAFRDTWQLGIHSYLSYLRDRLVVARDLLTESGSIFVQIGDENVHLVRCILDEVFGSENCCNTIAFKKTGGLVQGFLPAVYDHLLWYSKDRSQARFRQLFTEKQSGFGTDYQLVQTADGRRRRLTADEARDGSLLPEGARVFQSTSLESENPVFDFEHNGRKYTQRWKTNPNGMHSLALGGRLFEATEKLRYVRFVDDFPAMPMINYWDDTGSSGYRDPNIYVVQTVSRVVERCLLMTTDPGDLVLDPTCGSGTTAYVAEQWGRRWITIDTSRVALALARTRLMAGRYPYYLLADSPEGAKKAAEVSGTPYTPSNRHASDVRQGFVYKRVSHVTLKSIANNSEIDAIHAKWQPEVDAARAKLNAALGRKWEEWQVPREAEDGWGEVARAAHAELWRLRRERQKEIDASIARHADSETLYDQPYDDSKRVRVAGPFTVESLSPHRVLAADEDRPAAEVEAQNGHGPTDFVGMILDNLKKAGVQNTKAKERLKLETLEPYAGTWLQAKGTYTDAEGKARSVAVSIGPEHGTAGPELVKEAAKEAVQGVGFDLLLVCGFAFDPHVSEEAKRYGKLTVLPVRMNPDLAMGDELLKKTGAGNLFMVFGEPDVAITKSADGKLVAELRGLDIYDPTTGELRASSTDDIACWFVDTDYNGESFFVRHAYFTGADRPYDKLKQALRAEIDEAAWAALYSTKSRPFARPKSGKVAVKVINHYGDEVLKVYQI